ncbi:hypothetical protein PRECH8_27490 [Insulibacter thermoxylanivorax]|uniref:Uncharacterized protein n=1 Tax=Insulibacter thermoxylanivorax TaxID=2749268 RepID=A0A916QI76_9BACL|nr:hypothetical protein PRECH8_27490 [Insulibacter thermoxylanivorax]
MIPLFLDHPPQLEMSLADQVDQVKLMHRGGLQRISLLSSIIDWLTQPTIQNALENVNQVDKIVNEAYNRIVNLVDDIYGTGDMGCLKSEM